MKKVNISVGPILNGGGVKGVF